MAEDSKFKSVLIGIFFFLLAAIVFGLIWFFFIGPKTPVGFGWYLFSFTAGLSMIVLPCTLPLAFVIVPLSMGKGAFKGLLIALAFGIGVAFTLSLYGVLAAILGKVAIGTLGTPLEVVKNWLYFIAGTFAYLFALGELGLLNFRMPTYSGALPGFIQKQQDVIKALLLGLFLGNIGIGCPHPATPVILTRIAVSGDVLYGWLLFFVHAAGRVVPLIFLAILGILGVNALSGLVARKEKIERATGWAMVFVAGFILVLGLFSHDWWVISGQHTYLEGLTQEQYFLGLAASKLGVTPAHEHGLPSADHTGLFGLPLAWGTWVLLFLWIVPFFWYYHKKKKAIEAMPESEKTNERRILPYLFWNSVSLSLLLVLIFGYVLPNRFLAQATASGEVGDHNTMAMHGVTHYHEEADVQEGVAVNFTAIPSSPKVNQITLLNFLVNLKPENVPVPESSLELQHEKKMHVIGVRKDLNQFFHIHPVATTTPGLLSVAHSFVKPGDYKIWSEIKYDGEDHVFGYPLITARGEGPTSTPSKDFATSKIVNNYQVAVRYDELVTGENEIHFSVKNTAGQDADLADYLAAKMHLSIISEDLSEFIHTHPENNHMGLSLFPRAYAHGPGEEEGGTGSMMIESGGVPFNIAFSKTGSYKMFAQFRPSDANLSPDESFIAEFWVNVAERQAVVTGKSPTIWWRNLIVALILIVFLSLGVKKYITVPEPKKL